MSSHQNGDDQFEQFHAWRASQQRGPQLNFGASLGDFEAARGPRYGEFNQFNRSSMMFPNPSSSGLMPPPTDTVDHILRIAAQLDHEVLVRSGNEAYANALALHKGTKAELDSLRRSFEELVKGRHAPTQVSEANVALKTRTSGIPRRTPCRKEENPDIKFWTRKQYEDAKAKMSTNIIQASIGNTSNLRFVEHEDGTPVTEGEASKIRETARSVFAQLLQDGTAPAKWGQVSVVSQDFFFNVLVERFPYIAICKDMWKAQLIATTCYPSWFRNNKERLDRQRRDRDRQEREKVWIAQQLEHTKQTDDVDISGRESKAELIDHADHLEFKNSKRDLSISQDGSAPEMRPTKKAKSIGSSGSAKIPAPLKVSASSVIPNPSPFPTQRTTLPRSTTLVPPPSNIASSVQHHVLEGAQSPNETLAISRTESPVPSFDRVVQRAISPAQPGHFPPSDHSINQSRSLTENLAPSPTYGTNSASDGSCMPECLLTRPIQPRSASTREDSGAFYTMPDESSITGVTLDNPSLMGGDAATIVTMDVDVTMDVERHGIMQLASKGSSSCEAALNAEGTQHAALDDGLDEWELVSPSMDSTLVVDAVMDLSQPFEFDLAAEHQVKASLPASPAATYPPNLPIVTTPDSGGADLLPSTVFSGSLDFDEQTAAEAQDAESTAEVLLALHRDVPPGHVRPSTRNPLTSTVPLDFNQLFDRSSGMAVNAIRNPLADMVKERIPSTNVAQDLSSLHEEASADKENTSVRTRGRGRPAGKTASPDQLIKPTKDSLTPRNLFALEYKETNRSYPTEAMWQNLEKAETERLEKLSKERKSARKEAKADSKATAGN